MGEINIISPMKYKTIIKTLMALSLVILSSFAFADEMDDLLMARIKQFRLKPYGDLKYENTEAFKARANLGRFLYTDGRIAGNQNMNCMICHHAMLGTTDRLPLSQTQNRSGVLKRNSSTLFNIGDESNVHFMFWDGRVHYNTATKVFTTPEPALNGENPIAKHITSVMTSAASMQAIFPMITSDEMMGERGENEIADAQTNLEKWDLIVNRMVNTLGKDSEEYVFYFQKAFPGLEKKDINIGHFGEAIYTFMKVQFHSNGSPFHKYIAGDASALTLKQKKGFEIFTGKGKCIACHQGNLLGQNQFFANVGVPSYGASPFHMDKGRGEVVGEKKNFMFKTPSLINLELTAPYMHNGAFKTIRDVINHYSDIGTSLRAFEITPQRKVDFPVSVETRNAPHEIDAIWASVRAQFLKNGLNFTDEEKDNLEEFLKNGLTDPRWKPARR